MRQVASTLIELSVAIAIIAALLFLVFSAVWEKGCQTTYLSKMHHGHGISHVCQRLGLLAFASLCEVGTGKT